MRKKNIFTVFVCLLMFTVVAFTGCGSKDDADKRSDGNANNAVSESDAPVQGESENLGTAAIEAQNTEDFAIETPYCTLYYPVQWQEQVRIEAVEGDAYTVQFYAQMEGKEEQHLFDVYFGSAEGSKIGDIKVADGTTYSVSIASYESEMEGWTEEEKTTIWVMQEAVNHLISKLEANESFDSIF